MRTSGSLELNVYSGLFWSINIVTHHFVLNICIHFRLHFHNPSFGLHTEEGPSSPAPPPVLIPGQHQYTNPIESSGANDVSSDLTSLHNIRWTQSVCLFHIKIINLLVSQQFRASMQKSFFRLLLLYHVGNWCFVCSIPVFVYSAFCVMFYVNAENWQPQCNTYSITNCL